MMVRACKAWNGTFPQKWGGWRESEGNLMYVHSRILHIQTCSTEQCGASDSAYFLAPQVLWRARWVQAMVTVSLESPVPCTLPSVISRQMGYQGCTERVWGGLAWRRLVITNRGHGSWPLPPPTPRLCVLVISCLPILLAACYWDGKPVFCSL